tara:strand:- start:1607 stop:1936 length:330 start_codon:yes stop_codon:yes gene_type:complete
MKKKMKYIKILFLLNLFIFFSYCGGVKKAFTNQKKNGSDEFLVEKKSPLVMPPDYNELPVPEIEINEEKIDNNNIKVLITNNETKSNKTSDNNSILSIEQKLLKKIKKN